MRRPLIVANWKMAMTLAETRSFVQQFLALDQGRSAHLDLIICPPYTALAELAHLSRNTPIQVGAQDISAHTDPAHTGQISAALAADVGAQWVLIGHWEIRRERGDTPSTMRVKLHRALEAGLRPILLLGEAERTDPVPTTLRHLVSAVLQDCTPEEVNTMGFIYEPAWAIGQAQSAPTEHIHTGVQALREAITQHFGQQTAESIRIIYGGSVTPDQADNLLTLPSLDGLGMGRKGRDPAALAALVQHILSHRTARP